MVNIKLQEKHGNFSVISVFLSPKIGLTFCEIWLNNYSLIKRTTKTQIPVLQS